MNKSGKQIREEFIEFFKQKQHTFVASSSLLPADDPTLLFANAGMNQFKPIFLGTETHDYTRAANSQKCIRAGGKHNDLEDVGRDCYHHTFFEMLGNWSFGDYFKQEAIDWAWELLTEVWGLDKNRLHATYFEGDAADGLEPDLEARDLWLRHLPAERIHPGNKKDNFWEMGETGPCGPCSEVHIDLTDDISGGHLVNAGHPENIEIWNLVFIQFNRDSTGKLSLLPDKHVDTGMGLERVTAVMQGKKSNYGTDLFRNIINKIEALSGHEYGKNSGLEDRYDTKDDQSLADVAVRVIADHARSLTFAITDGILPGNEGRGSVLRSILRRAAGFGRQHLGIKGNFVHELVDVIVEDFGQAFPELVSRKDYVKQIILDEELSFGKTLDRGLELFHKQAEKLIAAGEKVLPGEITFELHATYGFPFSLTNLMSEKLGLAVDGQAHIELMEQHKEKSRGAGSKFKTEAVIGLPETNDAAKYSHAPIKAKIAGWVQDSKYIDAGTLEQDQAVALILTETNFYGESGGQVGDTGIITCAETGATFEVTDTQLAGSCVLHVGKVVAGEFAPGQEVSAEVLVQAGRLDTMRNHSATHMLNHALREVLGENVNQAGSVVDPEKLRFDFTYSKALTQEELAQVEALVNQRILSDHEILATVMPLDQAKEIPGVRAMFGEKYPDPVRVISIGQGNVENADQTFAIEFCGGTHLERTSQVGLFKIIAQQSVAKGIRRIIAITGSAAFNWVATADTILKEASGILKVKPAEISTRIQGLQEEIKKLKKRPAAANAASNTQDFETAAGKVVVAKLPEIDANQMRGFCNQQMQKGAIAIFTAAASDEKVMLIAMVDDAIAKSGKITANDWVKNVAPIVGGGGGGKPNLAQAGGREPGKIDEAMSAAIEFAKTSLA